MIKTFRGLLQHGEQRTIRLGTIRGEKGYRIVKLELIPKTPMGADSEHIVKVFTYKQETVDGVVDFDNSELLAAGQIANAASGYYNTGYDQIVFDNVTFNQDIFITHFDTQNNDDPCNYYLELERTKLSLDEASIATIKDMRGSN